MTRIKVFASKKVAREKLPDSTPRKVVIGDQSFCFVRLGEEIRAFSDLCPHQRASLSGGRVTAFNELVCPLHEYRFDLQLGNESASRCGDLTFNPIEETEEGIFIQIFAG